MKTTTMRGLTIPLHHDGGIAKRHALDLVGFFSWVVWPAFCVFGFIYLLAERIK